MAKRAGDRRAGQAQAVEEAGRQRAGGREAQVDQQQPRDVLAQPQVGRRLAGERAQPGAQGVAIVGGQRCPVRVRGVEDVDALQRRRHRLAVRELQLVDDVSVPVRAGHGSLVDVEGARDDRGELVLGHVRGRRGGGRGARRQQQARGGEGEPCDERSAHGRQPFGNRSGSRVLATATNTVVVSVVTLVERLPTTVIVVSMSGRWKVAEL